MASRASDHQPDDVQHEGDGGEPAHGEEDRSPWLLPRQIEKRKANCSCRLRYQDHLLAMPPLTIHGVPKRSTSMPKASAQKVFAIGMVIWPPSPKAANIRWASAAVGEFTDSEKPFIPW